MFLASIAFLVLYFGGSRLARAIAEADRLDPGWRYADLEDKRSPIPPPGKNGAEYLLRVSQPMERGMAKGLLLGLRDRASFLVQDNFEDPYLEHDRTSPTWLNVAQARQLRSELQKAAEALALARQMPEYPYGRLESKPPNSTVS
jgi:hypothetical protein